MAWYFLTVVALLSRDVVAAGNFFSFGCSQLVIERADPLVTPGLAPSPHVHQIVGGNSFNLTVTSTHSIIMTCCYSRELIMTR
jgi:hypothetical protein